MKETITNENLQTEIAIKLLENLCSDTSEILVVLGSLDSDLYKVISMRARSHHDNDSKIVVLSDSNQYFLKCLEKNKNELKLNGNKLSILHHWHAFNQSEYEKIINHVSSIAKKMPNLDIVILRGCSSAGLSGEKVLFQPRNIHVVSSKKNLEKITPKIDEFLFQQKNQEDEIITFVKYFDVNNECVTKELKKIPLNSDGQKLSMKTENALGLIAVENDFPPLKLLSQKNLFKIREEWLSNKRVPEEDKKLIRAAHPSTRTFKVKEFQENELADRVHRKLSQDGINVSVKGYVTTYDILPNVGTISSQSHGHESFPKALILPKK